MCQFPSPPFRYKLDSTIEDITASSSSSPVFLLLRWFQNQQPQPRSCNSPPRPQDPPWNEQTPLKMDKKRYYAINTGVSLNMYRVAQKKHPQFMYFPTFKVS